MIKLRTPKGTYDRTPEECDVMNDMIDSITKVFKLHGARNIDTPTFELKEILCNKYGSDSKLIFDLADQGGDICSLRYDLTVSLARYVAQNRISKLKRYQIGKVFRRDQPALSRGRLREFFQCDFDVVGACRPMVADFEVLCVAIECLHSLGINKFKVRLNHRMILQAIFKSIGIQDSLFMTVCSSIDKLDRITWKEVSTELEGKGLDDAAISSLESFTRMSGKVGVLEWLKSTAVYSEDVGKEGIDDMEKLLTFLSVCHMDSRCYVDLSLARGLDYYTGMIFEVSLEGQGSKGIGSVVGGGRYDNLVNLILGESADPSKRVPCVGFSLGLTRLLPVMMESAIEKKSHIDVYVASSGSLMLNERLCVLAVIRKEGIPADTFYNSRHNFRAAMEYVQLKGIRFLLVMGEEEWKNGCVKVMYGEKKKSMKTGPLSEMITFIKRTLYSK